MLTSSARGRDSNQGRSAARIDVEVKEPTVDQRLQLYRSRATLTSRPQHARASSGWHRTTRAATSQGGVIATL